MDARSLLALVRAGLSDREIERRTGASRKTVARVRREHGIPVWVLPLPEHGTDARWQHGCRCEPCHTAHLAKKRRAYQRTPRRPTQMPAEKAAELAARQRQVLADTAAAATRARAAWTPDELAIALDYQHTAAEAARLTSRSLAAVRHVRQKHQARPDVLPHRPRKHE